MSERNGYEPGVPCWVSAVEHDPAGAVAFYTQLMGWEAEDLMPPGHPASYYMLRLRGRKVAAVVSTDGAAPPPSSTWATHIWVDDADAALERVTAAGGSALGQPFDSPAGGRMAVVADPSGAPFAVWQPGSHRGAELVNEPGAWSMSMLHTSEPDGAIAFYTTVFGWTTEQFDAGGASITLFRLPGYVGGEPHQPVSREVIAGMLPAGDAVPRWSVDFWVADADGTAARTPELGGQVLVEPHDAPGFRTAVLADPGGAAFSINELRI